MANKFIFSANYMPNSDLVRGILKNSYFVDIKGIGGLKE